MGVMAGNLRQDSRRLQTSKFYDLVNALDDGTVGDNLWSQLEFNAMNE